MYQEITIEPGADNLVEFTVEGDEDITGWTYEARFGPTRAPNGTAVAEETVALTLIDLSTRLYTITLPAADSLDYANRLLVACDIWRTNVSQAGPHAKLSIDYGEVVADEP